MSVKCCLKSVSALREDLVEVYGDETLERYKVEIIRQGWKIVRIGEFYLSGEIKLKMFRIHIHQWQIIETIGETT